MLEFKDIAEYKQYALNLNNAIDNNSWKKFMYSNEYIDIYLASSCVPDIGNLSSPYFTEIAVSSVVSCNVSSARKIIPSNWERVVGAVGYILEDQCMPIAVIKLDGGGYYIENGKHRFYAHILLGKEKIPVSVREMVGDATSNEAMLGYNIPFYNNDGMDIAYPEKIENFIDEYLNVEKRIASIAEKTTEIGTLIADIEKNLAANDSEFLRKKWGQIDNLHGDLKTETRRLSCDFSVIKFEAKSVEMKKIDNVRHVLSIEMNNGKNIIITGSCSSGNTTRASKCTCNILNKLGYRVDMNYISNYEEFELEDKRDAHNMDFDVAINIDDILENITINIDKKIKYFDSENYSPDFQLLIKYVSNYKDFSASHLYADYQDASIIKIDEIYYYLVIDSSKGTAYIFKSNEVPFDNLNIQFLGILDSNNELYKKLI